MFLAPYLTFPGNCREAMTFYGQVFGAEPRFMTAGDMQMDGVAPELIMHSDIVSDQIRIFASDNADGTPVTAENNISLSLMGGAEDQDEAARVFAALAEGGQVVMPLEKQMWGDVFGMLVDQFGRAWSINVGTE